VSKNKLNNIILNIKENFNETEVLQVIQKNFTNFVFFDINNKEQHIYELAEGYSYDSYKKSIFKGKKQIKFTKKESLFLELLLKNSSRVVTYAEFSNHIWIDNFMTDCSIRSLVKNLRKKLPFTCIENYSGIGYKLF